MSVEEDMTIMAMVEEMTTVVAGTNDSAQLQIWRRQENECVGKKRSQRSQKLMQLLDLKAKDFVGNSLFAKVCGIPKLNETLLSSCSSSCNCTSECTNKPFQICKIVNRYDRFQMEFTYLVSFLDSKYPNTI
ncbi:hypothetical protein YC2023_052035 [Brassica napus]